MLLENDVHIGNFAEVKESRLGAGTKSGHFSYLGDAQIGDNGKLDSREPVAAYWIRLAEQGQVEKLSFV